MNTTHAQALGLVVTALLASSVLATPTSAPTTSAPTNNAPTTISCADMRTNPHTAFRHDIDLGSGHGSPTAVEYHCPESLAHLPLTQRAYQLSNQIRQHVAEPYCSGSIVHAQWRYYHFDLLRAGIAPALIAHPADHQRSSAKTWTYLAAWALQSPSQHRLYQAYQEEMRRLSPLLAQHYQRSAQLSPDQAEQASTAALARMLRWAAGAYPNSSDAQHQPTPLPPLVQAVAQPSLTLPALTAQLAAEPKPDQQTLDWALKTALVQQQPLAVVQALIDASPVLDYGDESALFFALEHPTALPALLKAGATVDYRNGFGKTALFYAVERDDPALVRQLLDAGANPNQQYFSRAQLEQREACRYNIRHGQRSVLMHAAQHASPAMLQTLLAHGADAALRDDEGWHALDYARKAQRDDNSALLQTVTTTED